MSGKSALSSTFFRDAFDTQPSRTTLLLGRTMSEGYGPTRWGRQTSAIPAMWTIISLNLLVWGGWTYARVNGDRGLLRQLNDNFILSWQNFREGRQWTLITSAFSHIAPMHLAFNMFSFYNFVQIGLSWIPGIGASHILALSLGSGFAGSAAFLYQKRSGRFGREAALGASGMVMGVGAAAACLMPRAGVQLMLIPVPLPLWAVTVGYVAIDTYFLKSETSRIGHSAHLGGAAAGVAYYLAFLRGYGGIWQMAMRRRR